jgi:hypothetical protein
MRAALQYAGWLIGLPLELLVIASLVRGSYRRFPFVLLYSLALFLTTVVEISVYLAFTSWRTRGSYYWVDEGIRQGLIFATVISLIAEATRNTGARRLVRTLLFSGAVVFAVSSFFMHYDSHAGLSRWMTLWLRDLNFSSAILDLALWALLLGARKKDFQLLMLSGGFGVQFTGEAIGQSLRSILHSWSFSPGDVLILLANLACLWIWWHALRVEHTPTAPTIEAASRARSQ